MRRDARVSDGPAVFGVTSRSDVNNAGKRPRVLLTQPLVCSRRAKDIAIVRSGRDACGAAPEHGVRKAIGRLGLRGSWSSSWTAASRNGRRTSP